MLHQPYRSRGLGSQSLQHVIKAAVEHTNLTIKAIYLHVQISNEAAKAFYERQGFKEVSVQQNYYKKLIPHDAWVLERPFTDADKSKSDL